MENALAEPLSYSRISTYHECPRQFEFKYVQKLETPPHWYFSYGKSIHAVLEKLLSCHIDADGQLYADKNDLFPTSLEQMLQENWLTEGYASPRDEEKKRREAIRVLTAFFPIFKSNWDKMLYTELTVSTELEGFPFIGIIDRIDRMDRGLLRIVDYKSSRPREAATLKSHRFQVALYAAALSRKDEFKDNRFILETYYLRENLKAELDTGTDLYIAKSREVLVKVAHRIAKGDFQGRFSTRCFACDYREICPTFHHRRSF